MMPHTGQHLIKTKSNHYPIKDNDYQQFRIFPFLINSFQLFLCNLKTTYQATYLFTCYILSKSVFYSLTIFHLSREEEVNPESKE